MRILDKTNLQIDLTKLGFQAEALQKLVKGIEMPYGMVLVTGPTGSGKTTTLYSALNKINLPEYNIMTAEDPVEYNIDGINQVMVHEEIGLTFAAALKAFLRQDPNIVMVGEIRDLETASIAVKAALTGPPRPQHAPHERRAEHDQPNDRHGHRAVPRRELGQRHHGPAARAQALREVQEEGEDTSRGAPRARGHLRRTRSISTRPRAAPPAATPGYSGRTGLYEVMPISDALREMILNRASASEIKEQAVREGMITLRGDGILKLKNGITSLEEVLRESAA